MHYNEACACIHVYIISGYLAYAFIYKPYKQTDVLFNFQIGADRLLLIGPEGGWSKAELSLMESARVQRVSVGATTLRAESTPGAAMAILNYLDQTEG